MRIRDEFASRVLAMESSEIDRLQKLIKKITAQIEGQNWTDEPLTDQDENLIAMAVSAAFHELTGSPR